MEIIKNGTFPAFPEFASWESTLECNMSCKHCGLACGPNKKNARGRELTAPEARVMLEKLREFGVRNIVISGGEFLLRADSYELAAQALDTFDSVRIISNGWLGSDILRHLEILPNASKLVLSLSIDGPERIHDEIRRPGSFKRTTSQIGRAHV